MGEASVIRVRPTWATPDMAVPQVLVRQASSGRRFGSRYEVAYYPEGLPRSPEWVRLVKTLGVIPGRLHTTDLHDLIVLLTEAASEHDDRWIAWPVYYPAVVRDTDLRPLAVGERELLDNWRERQRQDPEAAGRIPLRIHHRGLRESVVAGFIHELTASDRTRCGLPAADVVDLDTTFSAADPLACPTCARGSGSLPRQ